MTQIRFRNFAVGAIDGEAADRTRCAELNRHNLIVLTVLMAADWLPHTVDHRWRVLPGLWSPCCRLTRSWRVCLPPLLRFEQVAVPEEARRPVGVACSQLQV